MQENNDWCRKNTTRLVVLGCAAGHENRLPCCTWHASLHERKRIVMFCVECMNADDEVDINNPDTYFLDYAAECVRVEHVA